MSTSDTTAQIALVTGASRGIGRAIANALAAQGFKVVGTATTDGGAQAITDSGFVALREIGRATNRL